MFKVCIVCPCYNEINYVEDFYNDLIAQTAFSSKMFSVDVFFIDGGSTDGTKEFLEARGSNSPQFTVLHNEHRFVSAGLNLAIQEMGKLNPKFLIRMDLHSRYPLEYVEKLISSFLRISESDPRVGNVGFAVETVPSNDTLVSQVIARAMSSKFGVGGSDFRLQQNRSEPVKVDTVPFGCFRFEMFSEVGGFDPELLRNQDDEFNLRITKSGWNIYLLPDIKISYFPRDSVAKISSMFYQYGYFKPLVNWKLKTFASYRQFAPIVVLFVTFLAVLSALFFSILPLIAIICAYALLTTLFIKERQSNQSLSGSAITFLLSYLVLVVLHYSYGYGYFRGLLSLFIRKRKMHLNSTHKCNAHPCIHFVRRLPSQAFAWA